LATPAYGQSIKQEQTREFSPIGFLAILLVAGAQSARAETARSAFEEVKTTRSFLSGAEESASAGSISVATPQRSTTARPVVILGGQFQGSRPAAPPPEAAAAHEQQQALGSPGQRER
jgi:hypothetical protein